MKDSFGHWFSGFTDGEGYFGIHVSSKRKIVSFDFKIGLRDDDYHILEQVKNEFGFGSLGRQKPVLTHYALGPINAKPICYFRVRKKEECLQLINFFDKYKLRSKKKRDYEIWREAFFVKKEMKKGNRWCGPNTKMINLMEQYSKKLKDIKKYES